MTSPAYNGDEQRVSISLSSILRKGSTISVYDNIFMFTIERTHIQVIVEKNGAGKLFACDV